MLHLDSHNDNDSFDGAIPIKTAKISITTKTYTTVVSVDKDVCGGLADPGENGWGEDCVEEGLVPGCLVQHLHQVVRVCPIL